MVHHGLGKHVEADGPNSVEEFYLGLFICEILYTLTICLTKFLVLLFYCHIFAESIRVPLMVIALIATGWAIAVVCFENACTLYQSASNTLPIGHHIDFPMQPGTRISEWKSCSAMMSEENLGISKADSKFSQWDKSMNPSCAVNVYAFFIGNAVPKIVTDWALLFLPTPYIWRLQQKTAQKLALCGVFGLGGL